MSQEWNQRYQIGETTIDDHHQEVFQMVSVLDEVVLSQDDQKLETFISFLESDVMHHFEEEEALMEKDGYTAKLFHQTEHEIFRARVQQLRDLFDKGEPRAHIIFMARQFIDRLVNHIVEVDSGLGEVAGHE